MPLTRITLRQLEAFVAVAHMHSFAAASARLGLTPSAVSQLVAELEGIIGFRVFDRSTRKVALSSAGGGFLSSAEAVLRHLQLAETAAADMRNRAAGVVRIGAPLVLAGTVLPAEIREFVRHRPKVVVRIRDLPVDGLVEAVCSGEVDLAIGPDRPHTREVAREPVFNSPWVLWCSPEHPLSERRRLRWKDIHDVSLVAAGRDHERSVAQMHLNVPEGERVRPVDVVENITTALGLAMQGLAVTLAPAYVGTLAEKLGLVMKRVTSPEVIRQVCIYRPTVRSLPPAAEAFGEFLSQRLRAKAPGLKVVNKSKC